MQHRFYCQIDGEILEITFTFLEFEETQSCIRLVVKDPETPLSRQIVIMSTRLMTGICRSYAGCKPGIYRAYAGMAIYLTYSGPLLTPIMDYILAIQG